MAGNSAHHAEDVKRLAELGYKQQFERKWSGFSNFAVSFSIISILSGCFTTFSQAWNNGGPVAISVGWPIIASLILIIGFCMAELVSAMPTAGGIYYWSFKLGKPVHGWLTGWLNMVGLIAVIAGVDYGFATFFTFTVSLFNPAWSIENLSLVFMVFLVTVITHVLINVFGAKIIHWMQNVNVYWHVVGVAAIVLILVFIPEQHQSLEWMFTTQINNSGWTSYWFYVLPLGFLLTQYTITGFDASAHVSEETSNASIAAAKGIWQSIFYAGIGGWILLLGSCFMPQQTLMKLTRMLVSHQ
jgi:amino acid transporter